jgi:hypothetical protein
VTEYLVKIGNINEFGARFKEADGAPSRLSFASEDISVVRTVAGARVDGFSDQDVAARLSVEFANESAFYLRAFLGLKEMQNIRQVAEQLANAPGWHRGYRVATTVGAESRS